MHPAIRVVKEGPRGCGRRKMHGLYLIVEGRAESCGKLPLPLIPCSCCGLTYKFSRSPQWVPDPGFLFRGMMCKKEKYSGGCQHCPLNEENYIGPALLVWIGKGFYPSPREFMAEAEVRGVSRRIKSVPKGFIVGQTWVLLGHIEAIAIETEEGCVYEPGIFSMFKPTRIEIVVDGMESDEQIEDYLKRGLSPVYIESDQTDIEEDLEQLSYLEDEDEA